MGNADSTDFLATRACSARIARGAPSRGGAGCKWILAAVAALLVAGPAASLELRRVALSGDGAPDTGGASFLGFGPPVVNGQAHVSFTATLEQVGGVDATNDLGTWSEGATGTLALVERQAQAAAGASGAWDVVAAPPVFLDSGELAFRASLTGPEAFGIWYRTSGSPALAALTDLPAVGAGSGVSYAGPVSEPAVNEAGDLAFHAGLAGAGIHAGNDRALWAGSSSFLLLVAREGDAAPEAGGAAFVGFENVRIDGRGEVGFRATLDDGGSGVYVGSRYLLRAAARDGAAAPGIPGATFASFGTPDLASDGTLVFDAGLTVDVGGVTEADDRGVWAGLPPALALVAREGQAAPDSAGRLFERFDAPRANARGETLFRAHLDSGSGLYLGDGLGGISKVVASGDPAPGTDTGSGAASFAAFADWSIGEVGKIAFEATLVGSVQGVTGANDRSLWLRHQDGTLELVAREGDTIELAPTDLAVVESLDFHGASATRGRGLARGALAYGLTFVDGREAIYVPEAGLLGSWLAGVFGVHWLGRRRQQSRTNVGGAAAR